MAANPFVDGKKKADFQSKLTAAEWAAEAREKGNLDVAKAWDAKAAELGQERIPNGIGVRLRKGETTTYWVDITTKECREIPKFSRPRVA